MPRHDRRSAAGTKAETVPKTLLGAMVDATSDGFLITDMAGVIVWANRAAGAFFGVTPTALAGAQFGVPIEVGHHSKARPAESTDAVDKTAAAPRQALASQQPDGFDLGAPPTSGAAEIDVVGRDGDVGHAELSVVPRAASAAGGYLISLHDVTDRLQARQRLAHETAHDSLTGLPTRGLVLANIRQVQDRALRYGGSFGVIVVVVDQTAAMAGGLEYGQRDELYAESARRIAGAMTSGDYLGRIDHQTFALVCEDAPALDQVRSTAERIASCFSTPMSVGGHPIATTVEIGAVHATSDDRSAATLLRDARAASLRDARAGQVTVGVFTDVVGVDLARQSTLTNSLQTGIGSDEFRLHYQPIVSTDLREVHAVEALARWAHPRFGIVAACHFISVAEALGLIVDLDAWVLRTACGQARSWNEGRAPDKPLIIHVNISAQDLARPGFISSVREVFQETSVDPSLICIELTESALISDTGRAITAMGELKGLGCSLAIDDFGTAYASFRYLEQFPIDVLKIDKSFVVGLGSSYKDGVIVGSMIALADALGGRSIAEGVETQRQLEELRLLECKEIQGYLVAKPMSATDMTSFLSKRP